MEYSYSKDIKSNFNLVEDKTRESLLKVGFGVLTEISLKDSFKLKLDIKY